MEGKGRLSRLRLDRQGVGVIGVGNIGKEVFRLAKPWDMAHLGCDPNVPQAAVADLGVKMVDSTPCCANRMSCPSTACSTRRPII